ncbi:MAG: winged helix-turn-helix transcriptional regulator [Anaerolineales bacterium]|nr:winged helix-turn-helix transcriptional regulator [Anaerolineales bacterium]
MTKLPTGDQFLHMLSALANPQRLRILAALSKRQAYVSELARELKMSRPLLHMHLQRLEGAGLIIGRHEVSADGKALRYFKVAEFHEQLTPGRISEAVETLTLENEPYRKEKR